MHVDDDLCLLEVSKQILSMENNFDIDNATSVDEATKKMEKESYDVVVSDYEMPQKNGLDFLKELREQKRDIAFILFTGKGRENVAVKALNLGADSYINKNGSPETVYCELADAINKTVERKKSRELLSKSESKYHALFENSLQGISILITDPLRIVFANRAFGKITGYSPEELTSLSPKEIMSLIHHEERAFFFKRMENRLRGEPPGACFEFRAVRKDGTLIWLNSLANRVDYNGQPAIQGMFLDINESKKAAEIIRESEERYRELANCLPDIVFETDLYGKLEFANERAAEISGYSLDEIERGVNIFQFIAPEDRDRATKSIQRLLSGESYVPTEYKFIRKDGTTFPALITATPRVCKKKMTGFRGIVLDISERKKVEQGLAENEEKFRNLAEESPNMIFINLKGRIVYANKKSEEIMKYSKEEFYSPSFNFLTLIAPESIELLKSSYVKHMRGENVPTFEYGLVSRDGKRIEAIITSKLIEYDGQKAILGIITDITEKKRNEATLCQNEEQFRQLFSSMPNGVAIYEAVENGGDFVFRDFNSAAEKIEKISKADLLGKRVTEVFPYVKNFGIFEVFQRVWQTGQHEYFPVALYKDEKDEGSWRENWVYRLPNGNIIAIYNDISERMKTEVALRQERNMLESVTAASGAGLAIISKDYHVLWANDFIKRYKGNTKGKLCYASLNSLDAPCRDCGVAKIFAGKTLLDSHEYCSTSVDGHPYWVEIVATPLTDEKGNIVSAVEIAIDITERKKKEEKLRESIWKNELINEKLSVVGRLTRHDVGNKLMIVKSNMYLLKKQIGDNPKLAMYLEGIESAIDQSDKLFEFSRFYERIGVEEPAKIDVAQCFNQAAMLLLGLGAIRIVNDCQGLGVIADSLLKQLFYNFLDNSLKHGEKVTQIRLHYAEEFNGLNLFYEDNGVGIPEANKPKLFHEGFSTGKSTGLALFLIKKMVEVYGWTISEEGDPGKGAKFIITIPKLNKSGKENYQIS